MFDVLFEPLSGQLRAEVEFLLRLVHTMHLHLQHRIFSEVLRAPIVHLHHRSLTVKKPNGQLHTKSFHTSTAQEENTSAEILVLSIH